MIFRLNAGPTLLSISALLVGSSPVLAQSQGQSVTEVELVTQTSVKIANAVLGGGAAHARR